MVLFDIKSSTAGERRDSANANDEDCRARLPTVPLSHKQDVLRTFKSRLRSIRNAEWHPKCADSISKWSLV